MQNTKVILFLLVVAVFTACHKKPFGVKGKGGTVAETRSVSGFTKIKLSVDAEVHFEIDSLYYVEIQAQQNICKAIKTENNEGWLEIETDNFLYKYEPIKIIVHAPFLNALRISGNGKISTYNSITANDFDASVSGNGKITIASVTAQKVSSTISGNGNVVFAGGNTQDTDFKISGSGNMDALSLVSNTCKISVSGSGNAIVQALQELNVNISGSGSVKYAGTAQVNSSISGSGKLVHI